MSKGLGDQARVDRDTDAGKRPIRAADGDARRPRYWIGQKS